MANKTSVHADRDAIQDMVNRRGLASTVRLIAQVTASTTRYYQVTGETCRLDDKCPACAQDIAQAFLDIAAEDISRAMRN